MSIKQTQCDISIDELLEMSYLHNQKITWKKSQIWLFYWYIDKKIQENTICRFITKSLKSIPTQKKDISDLYIDSKTDKLYF